MYQDADLEKIEINDEWLCYCIDQCLWLFSG